MRAYGGYEIACRYYKDLPSFFLHALLEIKPLKVLADIGIPS